MSVWQYVDDEGQAQGPFSNEEMRIWFAVGWLRPDLLVRNLSHNSAVFRPLKDLNPKPGFCMPTLPKAPTPPPRPKPTLVSTKPSVSSEEAASRWTYLDLDGDEQGPYSMSRIGAWLLARHFNASTMVRRVDVERASDFEKLGDHEDSFRSAAHFLDIDAAEQDDGVAQNGVHEFDVDDQGFSSDEEDGATVDTGPASKRIWYYVDDNGEEQGPFSGRDMSVWYKAAYINADVDVRREGEKKFWKIGEDPSVFLEVAQPQQDYNWFYLDDDEQPQGPFPSEHMKAWLKDGYIQVSTRVRREDEAEFFPLSDISPLPEFMDAPLSSSNPSSLPMLPPPPPPPVVEEQWYYLDPIGNEQGPFSCGQMRIWYAQNLFNVQVRVRSSAESIFAAIGVKERPFMKADHRASAQAQEQALLAAMHQQRQQIDYQEYYASAVINQTNSRVRSGGLPNHWQAKGLADDRAGRQMSHYFDPNSYQEYMNTRKINQQTIQSRKRR